MTNPNEMPKYHPPPGLLDQIYPRRVQQAEQPQEAERQVSMDAGFLDARDPPYVVMAVRRWHRDGAWAR